MSFVGAPVVRAGVFVHNLFILSMPSLLFALLSSCRQTVTERAKRMGCSETVEAGWGTCLSAGVGLIRQGRRTPPRPRSAGSDPTAYRGWRYVSAVPGHVETNA